MRSAFVLPILIAAALAATPAAATDIFRGSPIGASDTKVATVTQEGGIQVHRGAGSEPRVRPIPKPKRVRVIGGDNLWLVDRIKQRITGCELRTSTQVASSIIRCTTRKLSSLR